ncbi:MAG: hypothetical protein RBT71_05035 [Flavobacteriales bacterium]|jgi:hypothetical protein|nr:hypothetical protein [Flavobacteriales bacterium]
MRRILITLAALSAATVHAQGDLAWAGAHHAPAPDAPAERLSIVDGALPGSMELDLPEGTRQVDLLDGRGRVAQTSKGAAIGGVDIRSLRPGTWTLRAHTGHGMVVRRFKVLPGGHVWTLDQLPRRAQRTTRAPLD